MVRIALLICVLAAPALAAPPNVLFIISDDLSAEALGCYGAPQCKTPNIDRLAAEGVRFTRAYTQFPICGPSRAALMAGRYPQSIGIMGNGQSGRFEDAMGDAPSMAEHFRNNGYHTARVSKIYHMRVPGDITAGVDGPDHAQSWVEKHNFKAPEWMTKGAHEHLTNEKLDVDPDKHYGLGFGTAFYVVKGESDGGEQPDVRATTKAIEILERNGDAPFFLAVGLVRPHVPLVAPAEYYEPYPPEAMTRAKRIDNDWDDIPKAGITKNSESIGLEGEPDKERRVLSAYYASVTFMDAQVGRLLDALARLGLRENTIVVFTSDHGYHLGEHDLWQKVSLHEESARIPIVIAAPGIAPGTATTLAEQIDLYPTLADLAGLPIPPHCEGVSLAPALRNPAAQLRESAYSVTGRSALLRTDRWAYIKHNDGTAELYDMHNDPKQFSNLVDTPAHAEARASLQAELAKRTSAFR